MSQRLLKGMYPEFDANYDEKLFGLVCKQGRPMGNFGDRIANAGWYNKAGERLGWGDLSQADISRIARELEDDELFIILSEEDAFLDFVTNFGPVGGMSETEDDIESPGVEYVTSRAWLIIASGKAYYVDVYDGGVSEDSSPVGLESDPVPARMLSKSDALALAMGQLV